MGVTSTAASSGIVGRKAMLLAAGQGIRLRPYTERLPKCMVPLDGRPLLEHTVRWLSHYGVTELIVNLNYLPEAITGYFDDGGPWGVHIFYSREETALGTAGGVRNARWFFDGPFLVWYGDNLSRCRIDRLWEMHRARGGVATVALYWREDVTRSGIVGLDCDTGRITRFLEKPRPEQVFSHWVNAGIMILEPEVLAAIPAQGAPDFGHDVLPALLAQGAKLYGYCLSPEEGLWWIDTPEDLQQVEDAVASGRLRLGGAEWTTGSDGVQ